ncbi:hypothetical protein D1872_292470 [compost metagenome]
MAIIFPRLQQRLSHLLQPSLVHPYAIVHNGQIQAPLPATGDQPQLSLYILSLLIGMKRLQAMLNSIFNQRL